MRSLLQQTQLWRMLRGVKRALRPPRTPRLSSDQQRSAITWLNPPAAVETRATIDARFRLENRAGSAWIGTGRHPVSVRCDWCSYTGEPFDAEPVVVSLPTPLYPGEPQELNITIPTPDVVGDFILNADFVQLGDAFASRQPDSIAVRVPIPVIGPRTTDIDYHAVYRTANLHDNHWWVVGAYHSQEQYERSSRERLGMLQKHGLTPNSWVLDIGCGTGQMASVLQDYLTVQGGYSGCDIGAEAIAFCNRTFRKPNFQFAQSGPTHVPFTCDGRHDLAIFFSVFTHTFTDETALLMSEAKRLLKPQGVIVADVITSPLVERGAGHRGEMIVNRQHFERLAAMLGYDCDVIGRWSWNRHAERLMYVLRQHGSR